MSDRITILRCKDSHRAVKEHQFVDGRWESKDYDCGYLFKWSEREVRSIKDLSRLLLEIENDQRAFVIRGRPLEGLDAWVRRTKKGDERSPASFAGQDLHWVMFDLDRAEPPPEDVATGPCIEAVKWAIKTYLPEGFHEAACHYQWSNSAGIKAWSDGLRLHLFFWLDRRACDASWRAWARERRGKVDAIDAAPFTAVQPHFTGLPIVKGLADPVAERSGLLSGDPCAILPAELVDQATWDARLEQDERERREAARARPKPPESKARDARQAYARQTLANVCEEILGASEGARHDTINGGAYKIGRLLIAGGLDYGETLDALQNAALAVLPKSRHGEALRVPREALEAGMADPRDLADKGTRAGQRSEPSPEPPPPPPPPPPPERSSTRSSTTRSSTTRNSSTRSSSAPSGPDPSGFLGLRQPETGDEKRAMDRLLSGRLELVPLLEGVPDAPVKGHVVPHGYWMHVRAMGLWKLDKRDETKPPALPIIAHAPLVVDSKTRDLESGVTELLVKWRRGKSWSHAQLPRSEAAQANRIVALLASVDFPITSASAAAMVKYLDDYQAANYEAIPSLSTTSKFGWIQGGRLGFVIGSTHIMPDGRMLRIDPADRSTWSEESVAFKSVDNGADAQLSRALHSAGTFEAWRDAVRRLGAHPRCLIGLVVSLSSLFLEVVGAGNYCLDWGCSTTGGKTTSLIVAMSSWGDPRGLMRSWQGTGPGIEGELFMRGCVPFFLDDTKRVTKPEVVTETIYMVADGRGKMRGNLKRANAVAEGRTVLLSTGERPAVTFDESGGARVRCLEVTSPAIPPNSKELITATEHALLANYGHAVPRVVAALLERRDEWPDLKAEYQDEIAKSSAKTDTESRVLKIRALLNLTFRFVDEVLELDVLNPVPLVWDEITAEVADAAGSGRALSRVLTIFAGEQHRFKGTRAAMKGPPGAKLLGSIVRTAGEEPLVLFLRENLDDELKRHGFTPETVYRDWKANGISRCGENRVTYPGRVGGVKQYGIALPLSHFAAKEDFDRILPASDPQWAQRENDGNDNDPERFH